MTNAPDPDYAQVASDPSRVRAYADTVFALYGADGSARLLMACADEIAQLRERPSLGALQERLIAVEGRATLLEAERDAYVAQRDDLWALLDNIDTLDDSCRDDDRAFRDAARRQQKKRFDIYNPDAEEK